jgi:ribosomal protein S18 acetylase RimI-like enzyme
MTLRRATLADLSDIKTCARAAYARYVPLIGREPAPMVADFGGQIARNWVWVAPHTAGLAGYIVFFPIGDDMFLENVAVHPDWSGQGIGRQLITLCEDTARAKGLRAVTLYTNAAMVANIALYPRLGYRETERRSEDGFDRVYFEKPLNAR